MTGLESESADAGEVAVGGRELEFVGRHGLHQRQHLALNRGDLLVVDLADGICAKGRRIVLKPSQDELRIAREPPQKDSYDTQGTLYSFEGRDCPRMGKEVGRRGV